MRTLIIFTIFLIHFSLNCKTHQHQSIDSLLPVRGFYIGSPSSDRFDDFLNFIDKELVTRNINTLILRIDFNYQYESYPNLRNNQALSKNQIKKLVANTKKNNIQLIPQINLLGHQSWANTLNNLLKEYPEFDETPHINIPKNYKWPNKDGLYCKSYCPLHPKVHEIVFALVDEIMEVFEAKSFHAGLDEVFYIGDDNCPRCKGKDKAVLFAGEVNKIQEHLALSNRELWIWGDRLLDGKTTGLGMWEASMNDTFRAIDMISKEVVICDWHYEQAVPTAAYFAIKGFKVVTCPWNKPEIALKQLKQTIYFRNNSTSIIKMNILGITQTIWSSADNFIDQYYGENKKDKNGIGSIDTFQQLYDEIIKLEKLIE